uniref:Uncharacterized protein n=1 Tax=Lotharella oceanica TaxID=641309 RepID=A0A7S2X8T0_9EUKA
MASEKELFMIWRHLSREDMVHLFRVTSQQDQGQFLASRLGILSMLPGPSNELRRRAMIELFSNLFRFCRKQRMTAEKISTLMSITLTTHQKSCGPPMMTTIQAFDYFKALLFKHSVERPPYSIAIYTPADIKAIVDYTLNTYFRHFKMYLYAFGENVELQITEEDDKGEKKEKDEANTKEEDVIPLGEEEELNQVAKEEEAAEKKKAAESEAPKTDIADLSAEDEKQIQDLSQDEQKEFYALFKDLSTKMQEEFQKKVSEQQQDFTKRLETLFASMKKA